MKLTEKKYEKESHSIWAAMYVMQMETIKKYNCVEQGLLESIENIGFNPKKIPSAKEISKKLKKAVGRELCDASSAFMAHEERFRCLFNKRFPVTDYMRNHKDILYTPLPDLFHEYFGHMPQMFNKFYADLEYKMAKIHREAKFLDMKIKLYDFSWWTIEYGVLMVDGIPKAVGAGLLSSPGDLLDFAKGKFELKKGTLENLLTYKPSPHKQHKFLFYFDSLDEWDDLLDEYVTYTKMKEQRGKTLIFEKKILST